MSPSAEPANATAEASVVVPAELLEDGEIVLLAVKPSGWFVLLVSAPVLAVVGVLAAGVVFSEPILHAGGRPRDAVLLALTAVAFLRVLVACCQWIGRLYVLTNRRMLRIRGIVRADVLAFLLKDVRGVLPTAGLLERPLGLGSLYFEIDGQAGGDAAWVNLSRPADVLETVSEAIRRAR